MIEAFNEKLSEIKCFGSAIYIEFPFESWIDYHEKDWKLLSSMFLQYTLPKEQLSQWYVLPQIRDDIGSYATFYYSFLEPVNLGYLYIPSKGFKICGYKTYGDSTLKSVNRKLDCYNFPISINKVDDYNEVYNFNKIYLGKVSGFSLDIHHLDFIQHPYYPKLYFTMGEVTLPSGYFGIEKFDTIEIVNPDPIDENQYLAPITGDYLITSRDVTTHYPEGLSIKMSNLLPLKASGLFLNLTISSGGSLYFKISNKGNIVVEETFSDEEYNGSYKFPSPVDFDEVLLEVRDASCFPKLILFEE